MLRKEQGKALLLEMPEGLRKLPRPGGVEVSRREPTLHYIAQ